MNALLGRRPVRLLAYACGGLLGAVIAATVLAVWPAGAATTPAYTDPSSTGFITLYDSAGRAVKSGRVTDKPFVTKAVSSQKAPAPYDGAGRKATLFAYQPAQGVSPLNWNGDKMTASTPYPDPTHPTASATSSDFSLQDYLSEFPASWNGYVQLRIYLGVPNQSTLNTSYVTTDLQVTGGTWRVIGGGPGAGTGGANIQGVTTIPSAGTSATASGSPGASPAASGASAVAGAGASGAGADSGGTDAQDTLPVTADLPYVSTPRVLIIGAAAIVGIVLVGLLLRRVPLSEEPLRA